MACSVKLFTGDYRHRRNAERITQIKTATYGDENKNSDRMKSSAFSGALHGLENLEENIHLIGNFRVYKIQAPSVSKDAVYDAF